VLSSCIFTRFVGFTFKKELTIRVRGCPKKMSAIRRDLSSADIFSDKGGLQMRTSTFLVQKSSDFRNLWCVRTDKKGRGLSQCGYFANKGGGFSRFCADVFLGRPLSTYHYCFVVSSFYFSSNFVE